MEKRENGDENGGSPALPSETRGPQAFFWILLCGALLAVYWPLLLADPLLSRDDTELLRPLLELRGVHDFLAYLGDLRFPDLQPVRDLSYLLDIRMGRTFQVGTFHWQNLLIWLACCFSFRRLLRALGTGEASAYALTALFSLHPMATMSVSWVSARKHLLAFLFLTWTLRALQGLRRNPASRFQAGALLLCYFLSVLSQPIYVLFPVWLSAFYLWPDWREDRAMGKSPRLGWLATALLLAMLFLIEANRWRYGQFYLQQLHDQARTAALGWSSFTSLKWSLLALGRYFFQFVAPYKMATLYSKASPENAAGLLLLPPFCFACLKILGRRTALRWLGFSLLMLGVVLTKLPTVFASDTYSLGGALGLWLLSALLWEQLAPRLTTNTTKASAALLLAACLGFFAHESATLAKTWVSDAAVWENAYRKEPDCISSSAHAEYLLQAGRVEEALEPARFHLAHYCLLPFSNTLFYLTLYYDPRLALEEKLRVAREDGKAKSRLRPLIEAALLIDAGRDNEASLAVQRLTGGNPGFRSGYTDTELRPLIEAARKRCGRARLSFPYCESLLTDLPIAPGPPTIKR